MHRPRCSAKCPYTCRLIVAPGRSRSMTAVVVVVILFLSVVCSVVAGLSEARTTDKAHGRDRQRPVPRPGDRGCGDGAQGGRARIGARHGFLRPKRAKGPRGIALPYAPPRVEPRTT